MTGVVRDALLWVRESQDWVPVPEGQWVVRGPAGDFYPVSDEVFRATYTGPVLGEPPSPRYVNGQLRDSLTDCTDASVWAKRFVALASTRPEFPHDEDWVLGWFANAIMAGYDEARRRAAGQGARL